MVRPTRWVVAVVDGQDRMSRGDHSEWLSNWTFFKDVFKVVVKVVCHHSCQSGLFSRWFSGLFSRWIWIVFEVDFSWLFKVDNSHSCQGGCHHGCRSGLFPRMSSRLFKVGAQGNCSRWIVSKVDCF